MRVTYSWPYWGRLALSFRTHVWMVRHYPQVWASEIACTEQELAAFMLSKGCKNDELQPTEPRA